MTGDSKKIIIKKINEIERNYNEKNLDISLKNKN
jgi:hypothetical protein